MRPVLSSRLVLVNAIRAAVRSAAPFAMGRSGDCGHWMGYALRRQAGVSGLRLKAMEAALKFHCLVQNGIYPTDPGFVLRFNREFVACLRQLDFYGLSSAGCQAAVLQAYQLRFQMVDWQSLHPDRSVPSNPDLCFLPALAGRRVLLVSPLANLLAERANRATFERVWSKIGKAWFYPAEVIPVEIPFAMTQRAREVYPTVLDLCDHIMREIATKEFDVALIGASGLGIPIASKIKALGKIGLSIGGDLQVLFGVRGRRWRERPHWQERYFNAAWIDVPARYFIPEQAEMADGGAYW